MQTHLPGCFLPSNSCQVVYIWIYSLCMIETPQGQESVFLMSCPSSPLSVPHKTRTYNCVLTEHRLLILNVLSLTSSWLSMLDLKSCSNVYNKWYISCLENNCSHFKTLKSSLKIAHDKCCPSGSSCLCALQSEQTLNPEETQIGETSEVFCQQERKMIAFLKLCHVAK